MAEQIEGLDLRLHATPGPLFALWLVGCLVGCLTLRGRSRFWTCGMFPHIL